MNTVFVSYKRDDELRVTRLVRGLESAGFAVWWDRGLAAGESWRAQLSAALDAASCVIVVWSRTSVGPSGDFVRDEAARAKRRNVLVPVLIDRVEPPLGFGEIQAIDLTRWRGRARDPFFQDLVEAVRATLADRPIPPAKGPVRALVRRMTYGAVMSGVLSAAMLFSLDVFAVQGRLCRAEWPQPSLSDVCGALALGDRPTRVERLSWEARERGNCEAIRLHLARFPDGAFRERAGLLLDAREVKSAEVWTPGVRRLTLVEPRDDVASADEVTARASAIKRAQSSAEALCRGFAATTLFRVTSSTAVPQRWTCSPVDGGTTCGFEGEAVCELHERRVETVETCGS
jgi:hypothetical protein